MIEWGVKFLYKSTDYYMLLSVSDVHWNVNLQRLKLEITYKSCLSIIQVNVIYLKDLFSKENKVCSIRYGFRSVIYNNHFYR